MNMALWLLLHIVVLPQPLLQLCHCRDLHLLPGYGYVVLDLSYELIWSRKKENTI